MTAFHLYALNAAISVYGAGLFLWWWRKTGRASGIYILVTILFIAEAIEKTIFSFLRWQCQYGETPGMLIHREIVTHPLWWTVALPTTIAFGAIVIVMTRRIYRSHRAMKRAAGVRITPAAVSKHLLLISNRKASRTFFKNVFATAHIEFDRSDSVVGGLETLVMQPSISVVVVGLSAIEDSGLRQSTVVKMIKKERPWCYVVALSRQPNLYELVEARRSFFDDYLYLPIRSGALLAHFHRWIAKVSRWKKLDYFERRKKNGTINQRQGIRVRRGPDNRSVQIECPGPAAIKEDDK
jgi:hypothetical protein